MRPQLRKWIELELREAWLIELSAPEYQLEAEDMAQEVLAMCREATKQPKPLIEEDGND